MGSGLKSICTQPAYNGIKDVVTSVYREGGMRALYRGVGEYVLLLVNVTMLYVIGWRGSLVPWVGLTALLAHKQGWIGIYLLPYGSGLVISQR